MKIAFWANSLFALVAMILLAGCSNQSTSAPTTPQKPRVVCTTGQVADMVRAIGGEHISIRTLMGPGVDPHMYRTSPEDNHLLQSADLIFYSGLHLEGKIADMLHSLNSRKPTLGFGEVLEKKSPATLRHPPEFETGTDPHVWFNAELWSLCIPAVVEKLSEVIPAKKDEFTKAGEKYKEELLTIHKECKEQLATIPKDQRVMITAHDAFGYFGAAYDIEVRGLQGISTTDEITLNSTNSLIDLLVSRKIKAVFVESSVSTKTLENVIKGCAEKGHTVIVGGELYSDAMGAEGSGAETYVGMMRANLKTIVHALK
jgi:manganese/zinc/iron transport system substrate-binding protein